MARIRTIKPQFWSSEDVAGVSLEAAFLFIGLISAADDFGRLKATGMHVKAAVFPMRESITEAVFTPWLWELVDAGLVVLYGTEKRRYAKLPTWKTHQKVSHPTKSVLPDCGRDHPVLKNPANAGASVSALEPSGITPEASGWEGNGREGKGVTTTASAPTDEDTLRQAADIAVAAMDKPSLITIWTEQIEAHHFNRPHVPAIAYVDAALDLAMKLRDDDSDLTVGAGNWAFFTKLVTKHQNLIRQQATENAAEASITAAFDKPSEGRPGCGPCTALRALCDGCKNEIAAGLLTLDFQRVSA